MKFHPDKNNGNLVAENIFKEVAKAYEVLSHPKKRTAYNQRRWYGFNADLSNIKLVVSSELILYKCEELHRYLSHLNADHINIGALNNYILHLLSDRNLEGLIAENNSLSNELIIKQLLKSVYPLPIKFVKDITARLTRIANDNEQAIEYINKYTKDKRLQGYWEQYLPLLVLFVAILICVFIYYLTRI